MSANAIIIAGVVTTLGILGQALYWTHKAKRSRARSLYNTLAIFAFQLACVNVVIFVFIFAISTPKVY